MSTTASNMKKKTPAKKPKTPIRSKPTGSTKPLRIRSELLPESATYGRFADREYVMIPVEDFADWYEDTVDAAVTDYIEELAEPGIPEEEMKTRLGLRSGRGHGWSGK